MRHILVAALAAVGIAGSAAPALAQPQSQLAARVDRLESEMHAVQRKVFPGGAGQNYIQPQITPGQQPQDLSYGTPASSPITDLSARVSSLESQMTTMTNTLEETQHRLQVLEDNFANYKNVTDKRLAALEGGGGALGAGGTGGPAIAAPPPLAASTGDSGASSGAGGVGSCMTQVYRPAQHPAGSPTNCCRVTHELLPGQPQAATSWASSAATAAR